MECGFDTLEQFYQCVLTAKVAFHIVTDILGLGTFALIAMLVWLFKRLRKDMGAFRIELSQAREEKRLAEGRALTAEKYAAAMGNDAERLHGEVDALKSILTEKSDELRATAARLASELSVAQGRIDSALAATAYDGITDDIVGFWSSTTKRSDTYTRDLSDSIPILLFGNQKGGVGKTMTVANLAASFATSGERVLVVDLDYQGSASSLMRLQKAREQRAILSVETRRSKVDRLFEPTLREDWYETTIEAVSGNLHYIPAYYSFEVVERSIEYQWTLAASNDDVRYRLSNALLCKHIQNNYDRVLLDAPPRFTLGFVNGICAATHVIVPMIVDQVSADAVEYFAKQFKKLSSVVNPALRIHGISGTVTNGNSKNTLPHPVSVLVDELESKVSRDLSIGRHIFIREAVIKKDGNITHAVESGIPYLIDQNVQPMYDQLAAAIKRLAPMRRPHESDSTQEAA
jgi:cellulose biosynthesis protein BcsQ